MGRLNDVVDRALKRVHVIQSVEGADRVGVCECPGLFSRTGARNTRSARRTLYFTSESRAGAQACEGNCADRSREHRLLPQHDSLPFRPPALSRRTLLREQPRRNSRKGPKTLWRKHRERFGPWPKERLGDGDLALGGPGSSRLSRPSRPRRGVATTAHGHPRTVFKRALQHENLLVAEATAREIGKVSLVEALERTLLIARKAPHQHPRVATRWLFRCLEESPAATIEEAGVVAACLCPLASPSHDHAKRTLRIMAETATRA